MQDESERVVGGGAAEEEDVFKMATPFEVKLCELVRCLKHPCDVTNYV